MIEQCFNLPVILLMYRQNASYGIVMTSVALSILQPMVLWGYPRPLTAVVAAFQDLTELCGGLEGRSPNPVAVLFDAVTHPDTDSAAGADTPALLRWRHRPGAAVPHVVLGTTQPGGAWQVGPQTKLIFKSN